MCMGIASELSSSRSGAALVEVSSILVMISTAAMLVLDLGLEGEILSLENWLNTFPVTICFSVVTGSAVATALC